MSNQIILKKSSVGAKVPLTTDLAFGELALNYSDGKLYYKDSSNAIQAFQSGSGTVSSLASFDRKLYVISTAGTNTLAVNYAVGYVDVYVNGVKLNSTEFTATTGINVTITLLSVNDEVQLVGIKPVNVGSVSTKYNRTSYTATAGQTTFNITYSRTSTMSYVEVYVNGIFIDTSEYTATTGTSITLVTAAAVGDIVDLVGLQDFQMFDLLVTGTGLGYNNTTGTISLASSIAATANTVALRDGSGNLNTNTITGTGLTISTGGGTNIANTVNIDTDGAGTARYYSHGANISAVGAHAWHLASSSGSIDTTAMNLDTGGRLTKALQPAFSARYTSAKIKAAGWNLMPAFDTTDFNVGGCFNGTTTFTAPTTGIYIFTTNGFISTGTVSADTRVGIGLQRNGVDINIGGGQLSTSDSPFPSNTWIIKAVTNDQIRLNCYSPVDITLGAGTQYAFYFSGYLLG